MHIVGLQKTTLLDYPGQVACTIFTPGCNFRCPFCHNAEIVEPEKYHVADEYSKDEIWDFLSKRSHTLSGVCVSGGEPTLQPDLRDFLARIHSLGLKIKLDSNGYNPDLLKNLIDDGLIDYIAMDIKSSREHYPLVCGVETVDTDLIDKSVSYIKKGLIPYEFRTTVVKGLHTKQDFYDIGTWLDGAKAYYLQMYTESEYVLRPGWTAYSLQEMEELVPILQPHISKVELRGLDYDDRTSS